MRRQGVFATVNNKAVFIHRLVSGASADETVGHKNGNKFDNRKENLIIYHRNLRPIPVVQDDYFLLPLSGRIGVEQHTKIDPADFDKVASYSWTIDSKGYISAWYNDDKVNKRIHRIVLDLDSTNPLFVDHINGDKLDNRRSNLRLVTHSRNMMNRGATIINTSGFKGVSSHNDKWRASISADNNQYHLGVFDTAGEAAQAYSEACNQLHGEYGNCYYLSTER